MRKTLRFAALFAIYSVLGFAAHAQSFTATWGNQFATSSVCSAGSTTNCVKGTVITGTANAGTPVTLCAGAGAATTCTASLPSGWSVFATWTILGEVQYYGSVAGTLLTTSAVNTGAGGNQISVENLVILAPTNVTATVQ